MTDLVFFFFQAEDGIRYLVRSRGLGDVYKRQQQQFVGRLHRPEPVARHRDCLGALEDLDRRPHRPVSYTHLTAADERSSVDLGGRRIIKKKTRCQEYRGHYHVNERTKETHIITSEQPYKEKQIQRERV